MTEQPTDTTSTRSHLTAALATAQSEMPNASLNRVNPHFKSKYADLAAIRAATLPSLNKYGMSLTQFTKIRDGEFILITRLQHTTGEFLESEYPLPTQLDKPQVMGSALTYARRYSWASMCGVFAEDDDDANAAAAESKVISHEQLDTLRALIDETETETAKFCKVFGIGNITALPATKFDFAVSELNRKKAKAND